ncbi:MAG: pyridoxamine 5'-phosphate oxidase family protein [Candidatus Saccharimonadales bacterium]
MNSNRMRRIHDELLAAGMTRYGLTKMATKELPRILHEDEHIRGVIYGKIGSGVSAMLVATDRRVVFVDRRALFMTTDELTYDVISGIKMTSTGPFTSVILHTRINDYAIRYVNSKCARLFTTYIERKRLEKGTYDQKTGTYTPEISEPYFDEPFDETAIQFLRSQDLGVISTVDRTGNVHGAFVHYIVDRSEQVYILTKSDTSKGRNIYAHSQVALTVHQTDTLKTLQLSGLAEVETDLGIRDMVFGHIVRPRSYLFKKLMPPVTKLDAGTYVVIRIRPMTVSYHDYAA